MVEKRKRREKLDVRGNSRVPLFLSSACPFYFLSTLSLYFPTFFYLFLSFLIMSLDSTGRALRVNGHHRALVNYFSYDLAARCIYGRSCDNGEGRPRRDREATRPSGM